MLLYNFLCSLGVFLSCYALYVEFQASVNPEFRAFCDISSFMSCSKVFTSEYGHLFPFLPNAAYGLITYFTLIILKSLKYFTLIKLLLLFCCLMSFYLGYVLALFRAANSCDNIYEHDVLPFVPVIAKTCCLKLGLL